MKKTNPIGARLRALREDRDLTQQQIADLLFINRRTYGAYENGDISASAETLLAIAAYYRVSTDYLLGRNEHPGTPHMPNRLRELRAERDLTQAQVARMLGISPAGYAAYEAGEVDIPTAVLVHLSRYCHVSIDYLLGESDCPDRR